MRCAGLLARSLKLDFNSHGQGRDGFSGGTTAQSRGSNWVFGKGKLPAAGGFHKLVPGQVAATEDANCGEHEV